MSAPSPAGLASVVDPRREAGQPVFTFDAGSPVHAPRIPCATVPRRRWLQDEITSLSSRYPAGEPVADIARRIGRSVTAVYGKARRLTLSRPPRRAAALPQAPATQTDLPFSQPIPDPAPMPAPVLDLVPPTPASPAFQPPVAVRQPKPFRLTKLGGRQTVWDPDTVQRLILLWVANFHHTTIAQVLDLTPCGIASKAVRISLPARTGVTLSKDLAAARRTDAAGGTVPQAITDAEGRQHLGKTCNMSGRFFYGQRGTHTSVEAKLTVHYDRMRQASL